MLARYRTFKKIDLPVALVVIAMIAAAFPALQSSIGYLPVPDLSGRGERANQAHIAPASATMHFEPNAGQTDPSVRYMAHTAGGLLYFRPTEVLLSLPLSQAKGSGQQASTETVTLQFLGTGGADLSAAGKQAATVNYITGDNLANQHTGIPTYSTLTYAHLYSGIDLRYDGTNNQLKGTYTVAPGTNPSTIRWRYVSGGAVSLDEAGNLQIGMGADGGTLTEHAPVAWQETAGSRLPVDVSYSLEGDGSIGFALGSYDRARPLVIDPAITYSTYLGGTVDDYGSGIATDDAGNAYVVGYTNSPDFPTLNAYQGSKYAGADAFVSKFNADGTLAFSTYFGGGAGDEGFGIAVDPMGNIYVTGNTNSTNLPVVNGYHSFSGGIDVFVSKFSNNGQSLLYSTYLGGSTGNEYAYGIAVDGAGNAYVEGYTNSDDFPARNAYQSVRGGNFDAFVTRLNTNASGDASLVYSTYLGGTNADYGGGTGFANFGHGVATDGAGNVYATGSTFSDNFPSRNGYQPRRDTTANSDTWVARLNTNALGDASLLYASFLGGNNGDAGYDIALDQANNVYILGESSSNNFPLRSSMGACTTNGQPFVAKFNMAASGDASLVYSTCFGSTVAASATALGVSKSGEATILGYSAANTWPLVNGMMSWRGAQDVVLAKLNTTGNGLIYSTYLGGSSNDSGRGLALDDNGYVYVTGLTQSNDFPTLNPYQPANRTHGDSFVTRIDECPVTFSDVHSTDYFYEAVRYLSCRGAISGYSDGTFRPFNNTTRGQLSKIMVNAEGWPISTPTTPTFSDVPTSHPFFSFIETAYSHGIISGYADGTFRSGNNVTRGQLCKIVVLAQDWTIDTTGGPHFSDVPVGSAFYDYVETAYNQGAISGYSDGTFRPGSGATRGQISKIVYNAITAATGVVKH